MESNIIVSVLFFIVGFFVGGLMGVTSVEDGINEQMEKANNNPNYIAFAADCSKYDTPLNCLKKWSNK
jgi:hypothetical protein